MRRRSALSALAALLCGGCVDRTRSAFNNQPTETRTGTPPEKTGTGTGTPPTKTETETPPETDQSTSTTAENRTVVGGVPVQRRRYQFAQLPYSEWPQPLRGRERHLSFHCDTAVDEVSDVPDLFTRTVDGESGHHPLRTARGILRMLHCYHESETSAYLRQARQLSGAFRETGTRSDGAVYFPYGFEWGGAGTDQNPPWYSGMGQGAALSAYVRFHKFTGEERYREVADRVFQSFLNVCRTTDGPWVTMVDDDSYFWIEEYPATPPPHVLNGLLLAVWGLYEYWVMTGRTPAKDALDAAVTTVEDHLPRYRVPGEVSWYSLNHAYRGNAKYHSVHIHQLRTLARLTRDPYFGEMARTFVRDHAQTHYTETAENTPNNTAENTPNNNVKTPRT